jgi:hypothetical protein
LVDSAPQSSGLKFSGAMPDNKSFASMIPRPEAFSRREALGGYFFGANNDLRDSAASRSGAQISASARRSLLKAVLNLPVIATFRRRTPLSESSRQLISLCVAGHCLTVFVDSIHTGYGVLRINHTKWPVACI